MNFAFGGISILRKRAEYEKNRLANGKEISIIAFDANKESKYMKIELLYRDIKEI